MRHTDLQSVRAMLIRIRSAKHLSQSDIASSVCTQGMISKIEAEQRSPSFIILYNLLKQMNISLSEFEFLLNQKDFSYQEILFNKIETIIDDYQYFILNSYVKQQKGTLAYPHFELFNTWSNYCFNINFTKTRQLDYSYLTKLINQDEFFNNDFYQLMYGLIALEVDTAFYNYNRLQDQLKDHQLNIIKPTLKIDAAITMASIFFKNENQSMAHHYFYFALQQSKKIENIPRIIICQIILSLLSKDTQLLNELNILKDFFSKDIFYDYWYNILYNKFNEV